MSGDKNGNTGSYKVTGRGFPVVLLHGYLESHKIWEPFGNILGEKYTVIMPDLPGHGRAMLLADTQPMDMLAGHLAEWLQSMGYHRIFLAGHSLGGYVTLAFVLGYPEMLAGFCLFHSHPYADTEETRNNRLREIRLVEEGKKELIVNTNIPRAFAPENVMKFEKEIESACEIARQTPDKGIIAMLRGMMARPDRSTLFFKPPVPALWILGQKDQYISFPTMIERTPETATITTEVLPASGHMGFIEEPGHSAEIISEFLEKNITPVP